MNESRHAYACLRKGACTLVMCTRFNVACYAYILESCHTFEWVMSHKQMVAERQVYSSNAESYAYVMWYKCACVMSHVSISHVTCMSHSRHMSHVWVSHVTCTSHSCHIYQYLRSPVYSGDLWMSHVTRMNLYRAVCVVRWFSHTQMIRVVNMNESCHIFDESHDVWINRVTCERDMSYGVATIRRLLKIMCLFYKWAL